MGAGWIAIGVALAVALGLFNSKKKLPNPPEGPTPKKEDETS